MQTDAVVPPWLYDVFLGYGDPQKAQYYNMPETQLQSIKFADTFLGFDHIQESLPGKIVLKEDTDSTEAILRKRHNEAQNHSQYEVTFPAGSQQPDFNKLRVLLDRRLQKEAIAAGASSAAASVAEEKQSEPEFKVSPYYRLIPRATEPKRNTVRFTPTQIEAIKSGLNPGLTIIQVFIRTRAA